MAISSKNSCAVCVLSNRIAVSRALAERFATNWHILWILLVTPSDSWAAIRRRKVPMTLSFLMTGMTTIELKLRPLICVLTESRRGSFFMSLIITGCLEFRAFLISGYLHNSSFISSWSAMSLLALTKGTPSLLILTMEQRALPIIPAILSTIR